jgi:hypothetical protein
MTKYPLTNDAEPLGTDFLAFRCDFPWLVALLSSGILGARSEDVFWMKKLWKFLAQTGWSD